MPYTLNNDYDNRGLAPPSPLHQISMPAMLTEEDLSLRHLPEISTYSFSFQIPTSSIPKGDDLMADDNTFFEGANNNSILATPAPPARAIIRPSSHTSLQFTPGPFPLESGSPHQRVPLPSESPRHSCGPTESQPLPINEAPVLGSSEAEDPLEEEGDHKPQGQEDLQEQRAWPFTSTTSTTTLSDIPSPPPVFVEGPPLGSHAEVGRSESVLPQIESRSHSSSAAVSGGYGKEQKTNNPKGSRKSSAEKQPGRSALTEGARLTAVTRSFKRVSAS